MTRLASRRCTPAIEGLFAETVTGPGLRLAQPASLNGSLFGSKRDRKIAASSGSAKQ